MHANVKKHIFAFLCLLLSVWMGAGVCVCENEEIFLPLNERMYAPAGDTLVKTETSIAGNYILCAFSDQEVVCKVMLGDSTIAEGALPLAFSMPKDVPIALHLSSNAPYTLEVMRASHGRNAYSAIELSGSMNRTLTRARDVHYFVYTAKEDETVLIRAQTALKKGVKPSLLALDQKGQVIAETHSNADSDSACIPLSKGESCLIRVWAEGDQTGAYALSCAVRQDSSASIHSAPLPESISLVTGEWTRLSVAEGETILSSDNESIFTVTAEGIVAAAGEGEGMLTAHDLFGNTVHIPVFVSRAAVTGVAFHEEEIHLHPGEFIYPAYSVLPPYAGSREVSFTSSDISVAAIDENGTIRGVNPGSCVVTVKTREGGFIDTVSVTVNEPESVYRALIVGIATYENERERTGCINTTQGMADALSFSNSDKGYLTSMHLDVSKEELLSAISETFMGATEDDVSLFYINCHGGMTSGTAWLEMRYGSKLSAMELEGALRKIPGTVVVIIDCCTSGAFIGEETGEAAFATSMISQFSGASGGKNVFSMNKYKVLVSSSASQNSYRMASSSPATEQNMSTVFARSLTEGIGWNLIKDRKTTLKADIDNNRQISLHEAWLYTLKKTMSYLNKSTARQTVQVWPRGDMFVLVR